MVKKSFRLYSIYLLSIIIVYRTGFFFTKSWESKEATISKKIVDHPTNRIQMFGKVNEIIATNIATIQPNKYTTVAEKTIAPTNPIHTMSVKERIKQNLPTTPVLTELFNKFNETANAPTTNLVPECLVNPGLPKPVILMSLGRSGSTVLWQMLTALTNSTERQFMVSEYVGGNTDANLFFFDATVLVEEKLESRKNYGPIFLKGANTNEIPGKNNCKHGEWLLNYLCRLRQKERGGGIVGFQWKPNLGQFLKRAEARESLQLLASLASAASDAEQKPPIIVVRSRRNLIDVNLSHLKHKEIHNLHSHCAKGDVKCVSKHSGKQFISHPKKFYRSVLSTWIEENFIDELLYAFDIPHVSVSYDTLFYPPQITNGEEEWNRMIQFVSPSSARMSWADILNSMEHEPTRSTRNHKDLIENFEDVVKIFQGTEIEHLLRND